MIISFFLSSLQTEVEEDILKTMQRLQDSVNNLDQTGTCQVDAECHSSFKELVQVRVHLYTYIYYIQGVLNNRCYPSYPYIPHALLAIYSNCYYFYLFSLQGNLDRSSRVLSHFSNTRSEIDKVS